MTYRDLLRRLQNMPPELLDYDLAVQIDDEIYSGVNAEMHLTMEEEHPDGVLDVHHPYLDMK